MEPEGSLPCSQKPATEPYPEPAESSSPIDPYLPKVHLNVIHPPTPRFSFRASQPKACKISPLPHACHMSRPPQFPSFNHPNNIRRRIHLPPSSVEVKEWVELYLYYPNTPSWNSAHLKSTGTTLPLHLLLFYTFESKTSRYKHLQCLDLRASWGSATRRHNPKLLMFAGYRQLQSHFEHKI
jgi:hypothetical protein